MNRQQRRALGLRQPIGVEFMREQRAAGSTLPRAVRRTMREPQKALKRITKRRAKVNRLLAPYGAKL